MGYVPIFLYLGSFILLFVLVVNVSIKNKKKLYQTSLEDLFNQLKDFSTHFSETESILEVSDFEGAESFYLSLRLGSDKEKLHWLTQKIKPLMGRTRQQKYWYNNLLQTKPYSFVAWLFGHRPI